MGEERDCSVTLLGDPLVKSKRGLSVERGDEVVLSRDRHGPDYAGRRGLHAIERILTGSDVPLFILWEEWRERETVVCVTREGQRYIGVVDGDLFVPPGEMNIYGFDGFTVSASEFEAFHAVDEVSLCERILGWVENSEELAWRDRGLTNPPEDDLSCLYRDGMDMLAHYREHGSLRGFELSRTKAEIERFVFEFETLPRTERYVREHMEVIDEVVLELMESELPNQEVVSRLRGLVDVPRDWVNLRVVNTLADHPDERAWAAWVPISSGGPEVQRATARMLSKIAHHPEAREFLEIGLESEDERTRKIAREGLEEADCE